MAPEGWVVFMASVRQDILLTNSCADNSTFIVQLDFFKIARMNTIDVYVCIKMI